MTVPSVLVRSPFKNPKCKEQKKFKVDAYLFIRESLTFLQRRSNWEFFSGLLGQPNVMPDPCPDEPRMRAIGKTQAGRYVFLVFMLRETDERTMLRPISARSMHKKEVDHYESQR